MFAGSECAPSTPSAQTPNITEAARVALAPNPVENGMNWARPARDIDSHVEAEFEDWAMDPARGGIPSPLPRADAKRPRDEAEGKGEGGLARQSNTAPAKKAKKNEGPRKNYKAKDAIIKKRQQEDPAAASREQAMFFAAAAAANNAEGAPPCRAQNAALSALSLFRFFSRNRRFESAFALSFALRFGSSFGV
ncbi:hypothetical protein T484DRAFT_1756287 [Baffinella frigidus]|nr:hypothetical protein T484DRAFT_1756287 [Cryptophyta sp. CCMP2293]